MEVHHHSPTERKKWSHYLWEFFMLFFAVSLGFLTENLREEYQDSHRVTAFMCKISKDLQADISEIRLLKQERTKRNLICDSLISLLTGKPISGDRNKIYYFGRNATRRIHFRPQNATLQQLKNTGDLRLVKDNEVLGAINHYEQLLKFNDENVMVEEKELSDIGQLAAKIFDASVFQKMTINYTIERPAGNPGLLSYDKALLNEMCVKLHYWKRTSVSVLESFDHLKKDAEGLLTLVTQEYHCK